LTLYEKNRRECIFDLKNVPTEILRFQKFNKKLTIIERRVSAFLIDCMGRNFISKVRTQQIIKLGDDNYIMVDFLIEKPDLIIEVDGPEHNTKEDAYRDKLIKKYFNYDVIRIKNKDTIVKNSEMRNDLLTIFAKVQRLDPGILIQNYWSGR